MDSMGRGRERKQKKENWIYSKFLPNLEISKPLDLLVE
jgi:hypothetical protein